MDQDLFFVLILSTLSALCVVFDDPTHPMPHQVKETTCQLYVACESAHVHLHEKHGRLAKIVHQVQKKNINNNNNKISTRGTVDFPRLFNRCHPSLFVSGFIFAYYETCFCIFGCTF